MKTNLLWNVSTAYNNTRNNIHDLILNRFKDIQVFVKTDQTNIQTDRQTENSTR